MEMFSDLRQFDEAKKWAEEYSRTKGDTAQVGDSLNQLWLHPRSLGSRDIVFQLFWKSLRPFSKHIVSNAQSSDGMCGTVNQ
eukprot:1158743-Pelagomonas_calceolata.AAC.21